MSATQTGNRTGGAHEARKRLFQAGVRRGFLTVQEIDAALPEGSLTPSERWLLYYSLRASEIGLRDETGSMTGIIPLSEPEWAVVQAERSGPSWSVQSAAEQWGEDQELHLGIAEDRIPLDQP